MLYGESYIAYTLRTNVYYNYTTIGVFYKYKIPIVRRGICLLFFKYCYTN